MKVIEVAHRYKLCNKISGEQELVFFKDLPESEPGHDGVLCQEVVRVLLDRVHQLHIQDPCHENVEIVQRLRDILVLFETRAVRRMLEKSYKVTGMHVEQLPRYENGHVFILEP